MSFFPFAAVVGQQELKLALLMAVVNPAVGGVLIRGEKGIAKSTAVRGLVDLLPEITVNHGCRFSCRPENRELWCVDCLATKDEPSTGHRKVRLVNLPLNATEDRVAGGIDFSATVERGKPLFQTGLLAEVHRGILYIDEVNLLDDHIVDLILDAASSGMNRVEREGISFCHPCRFSLIGTMNPEEGELRPQLLDRFGLCVEAKGNADLDERVLLLMRREQFDRDPCSFITRFSSRNDTIRQRIRAARAILSRVRMPAGMRVFIGELCRENNVAGHRADLVMEQAARTMAALDGDDEVTNNHILRVAPMVLIHRSREGRPPPPPPPPPPEDPGKPENTTDQAQNNSGQEDFPETDGRNAPQGQDADSQNDRQQTRREQEGAGRKDKDRPEQDGQEQAAQEAEAAGTVGNQEDQLFDIGPTFSVKKITMAKDRVVRRGRGRRSRSMVSQKQGRYSRAASFGLAGDIALDATIRAAAPFQAERSGSLAVRLEPCDFRYKIREKRIGNLLLFMVDGSGSMAARGRMAASKGAIMSLLLDAYQKRDKVAMVTFRRDRAEINLPVTCSVELAGRLLAEMKVGGRTPLSAGLIKGYELMRNYLLREPGGRPIVIILTDGKANVSMGEEKPVDEMLRLATAMAREERAKYIVVDTEEEGPVTFDLSGKLAAALAADYFKIKDIQAEELVHIVRETQ
ncbi:MAG TPA: VWA domain-containing protein [Desulfobulbus sp.]|nr:VWA domain-containing protein [Desulfobulbus sp.]